MRCAHTKRYFWASILSFIITLMGYLVFAAFLDGLLHGNYVNVVIYSVGVFFGAYAGFKFRNEPEVVCSCCVCELAE
jgi:hypothetical protein